MKQRPILFRAPMVRAILDGTKTMTRRIIKPQPTHFNPAGTPRRVVPNGGPSESICCPYGQPGDRLWCARRGSRQTAMTVRQSSPTGPAAASESAARSATADHLIRAFAWDDAPEGGIRWRASIHMPRWASRILLEITDVRVERVQDISDRDARDEGAEHIGDCEGAYVAGFRRLWESINGPDSWAANPWVWVIEFRRIEP